MTNKSKLTYPMFVSADAARTVLEWKDVVGRLRDAYSVRHGELASPPRVVARGDGNWLRALAAVPPGSRFMGTKVFGFGRQRSVSYLIALFDQDTGALTALVDGNLVTAYRTAATSAVAVDHLAALDAAVLGVLGSGLEAQMHIRAIAAVRSLREIRIFSPTEKNRRACAAQVEDELKISCVPVATPEEAVRGADLVAAAARSHDETPILLGRWLEEGQTIVSIGSTLPDQREIDADVVARCDVIVCDMPEEVAEQTGDMLAATAAGVGFEHKMVSLNDLLTDADAQRKAASARLPMFKSVGAAIQDIVVAELVYDKALEKGLAHQSDIGLLMKQT
jgi:ornithine cyclodeaminase/alanine dehydrogenase